VGQGGGTNGGDSMMLEKKLFMPDCDNPGGKYPLKKANSMMRPITIYSDLFSDDELEEIEIDKAEQAMDKEREE